MSTNGSLQHLEKDALRLVSGLCNLDKKVWNHFRAKYFLLHCKDHVIVSHCNEYFIARPL